MKSPVVRLVFTLFTGAERMLCDQYIHGNRTEDTYMKVGFEITDGPISNYLPVALR